MVVDLGVITSTGLHFIFCWKPAFGFAREHTACCPLVACGASWACFGAGEGDGSHSQFLVEPFVAEGFGIEQLEWEDDDG